VAVGGFRTSFRSYHLPPPSPTPSPTTIICRAGALRRPIGVLVDLRQEVALAIPRQELEQLLGRGPARANFCLRKINPQINLYSTVCEKKYISSSFCRVSSAAHARGLRPLMADLLRLFPHGPRSSRRDRRALVRDAGDAARWSHTYEDYLSPRTHGVGGTDASTFSRVRAMEKPVGSGKI